MDISRTDTFKPHWKISYIRKKFSFQFRLPPKIFQNHPHDERIPKMGLKKITWDSSAGLLVMKTTFPLIKLWSEGPILTNFWCLTTLLLWVEKILLVKNGRKWHFLEFFQLAIGISQPLPTLIFPLWYSLPTLIPLFFLQCLSWWSGCHGYPAMTKKGLWEAPLTEFSPQTVQNLW